MNWQDAIVHIQSPNFDAELNVVSGTKAFFRAVGDDPVVQKSLGFMRESGEVREEVLGTIFDLSTSEIDPRYENPYDTSLAVLLWLTRYTNSDFAHLGAQYVLLAPGCWYANKIARQIVNPQRSGSVESLQRINADARVVPNSSSTSETFNMVSVDADFRVVGRPSHTSAQCSDARGDHWVVKWNGETEFFRSYKIAEGSGATEDYHTSVLNIGDAMLTQNNTPTTGVGL